MQPALIASLTVILFATIGSLLMPSCFLSFVFSLFSVLALVTYYRKYLVIVVTPIILFLVVAALYLLPRHFDCFCFRYTTTAEKVRSNMKFWKLFLCKTS
jgi:hypothetical protein